MPDLPQFGPWTLDATRPPAPVIGLIIRGLLGPVPAPPDYLHDVLLAPEGRAAFFALVDHEGLVVCLDVRTEHPSYRGVRGRSSRGKLSQGEVYHHDGCSGPVKPRVVEIRFPHQPAARRVATAVAPFPETAVAMLRLLPEPLASQPEFRVWNARIAADEALDRDEWDTLQARVTRAIRRHLDPEATRAWFRAVDRAVGAYDAPWEWGESRFIANRNDQHTFQHRRAYLGPASDGTANGNLCKRWPAEELG